MEAGERASQFATGSVVLGVTSLGVWCFPCLWWIPLAGIVLGVLGRRSERRSAAIAGLVLNGIGALLVVANASFMAYLVSTGRWRSDGFESLPFGQPRASESAPAEPPSP